MDSKDWKVIEKEEKKILKQLVKLYQMQSVELGKIISQFFGMYGNNGVVDFTGITKALNVVEIQKLITKSNEFKAIYPEYAEFVPDEEEIYKYNRLDYINYDLHMLEVQTGIEEDKRTRKHFDRIALYSVLAGVRMLSDVERTQYSRKKKVTGYDDIIRDIHNDRYYDISNPFFDRWKDKEKIINYLKTEIREGLIRGDSYDKMTRKAKEKFQKASYNNMKRTIYIEGTFIGNEANAQVFEEFYDYYEFSAVMDNRTTQACRNLNGKIFKYDERVFGVNFPPIYNHWCRSSHKPISTEEAKKRLFID